MWPEMMRHLHSFKNILAIWKTKVVKFPMKICGLKEQKERKKFNVSGGNSFGKLCYELVIGTGH